MTTSSRLALGTTQLSTCIPSQLDQQFYSPCIQRGIAASDMPRMLVESFVQMSSERPHGQA